MSNPLSPGFLVAAPQLMDPNFRKTVVLLLQQGDDGAMGVVINRDTPLLLSDLCNDYAIPYQGSPSKCVRFGGPVQPEQGLVIYGDENADPEGRPVTDELHVSASTGTLSRLCSSSADRFQCFVGYAGWAPDQLEREIREGSWIIAPVTTSFVLECPPDEIWNRCLVDMGIDPTCLVPGGTEEA
jgi:putative transcriptional regulator